MGGAAGCLKALKRQFFVSRSKSSLLPLDHQLAPQPGPPPSFGRCLRVDLHQERSLTQPHCHSRRKGRRSHSLFRAGTEMQTLNRLNLGQRIPHKTRGSLIKIQLQLSGLLLSFKFVLVGLIIGLDQF